MLALLEHCVTQRGGTYVMEDTDSMAIVSTKKGSLIPCPGGNFPYGTGESSKLSLRYRKEIAPWAGDQASLFGANDCH